MRRLFKSILISACLILISTSVFADNPFVIVMYDSETEKSLGSFPPNRTTWASTIDKLYEFNAKAIVLKFFFDLHRPEDKILSVALSKIPTFLQACINENEPSNNKLDKKFVIQVDQSYNNIIKGKNGWLPINEIAINAFDLGFVDIRDYNSIPIIEKYNNQYVSSLYFSILKYVYKDLSLTKNTLTNHNKIIELNKYSEMYVNYPEKDELNYISLIDLINNKINKYQINNKIVIIGYDGDKSEYANISTGKVKKHRVFIYGLIDMYNQLKP